MMDTIMEAPEMGAVEMQKIVQQQLVLILHAHCCQQKDLSQESQSLENSGISREEKVPCKLPYCEETKQSLDHIRCCLEPENCSSSQCRAIREIIRHWKTCVKKSACKICGPVAQAQKRQIQKSG